MNSYIILYRNNYCAPLDPPLGFSCNAEDDTHAEEQFLDVEPDAEVVWCYSGNNYQDALKDYWNASQ